MKHRALYTSLSDKFVACLLLLGAALVSVLPVHATQERRMDIVGLTLGMTESEALAALKAHDPSLTVQTQQATFSYNDGINFFETEPFLSMIVAGPLQLYFTPPPKGGRLWAVDRKEEIKDAQPSLTQYTEALVGKYGTPSATSRGGYALTWDFPKGSTVCLLRAPNDAAYPQYRPRNSNAGDLMGALRAAQHHKRVPDDLSGCGSQLYYLLSTTSGDVINSFQAILLDIAAYATSEEAAAAHVEALEAEAKQAREGKGQAPKL